MIYLLISLISLAVLLKSADLFIDQSVALAKKIKISSFLIGFTLISLGTSLPDIVIGIYSTITNHQEITISTFIGSALVNVSLLLGILALFSKYKLSDIDVKKNIPVTLGSSIIFLLLLVIFKFQITWIMGIITVTILLISVFFASKNNHTITIKSSAKFNLIYLILSFVLLIVAGRLCVDNLVSASVEFGISQTAVGFFILAIGVSLPELVTCLTVIKRGNLQLSLGNILGATMINILLIPGLSSFFKTLDMREFSLDIFFLVIAILVFYVFAILGRKKLISKGEGIGLILVYIIFCIIQNL